MAPFSLLARALFVTSRRPPSAPATILASPSDYVDNSARSIEVLQSEWYDAESGLWDRAWWNSGNMLTTIAEFASLDLGRANSLNVGGIMRNTFFRAQNEPVVVTTKTFDEATGVTSTTTSFLSARDAERDPLLNRTLLAPRLTPRGFDNFINEYYDDEGWWALGLIRSWDVTGEQEYLDEAVNIFADMQTGGPTRCGGGGIYWNKDRRYPNAIANELYLSVAASLANRVADAGERQRYLGIARDQWSWFVRSGMINGRGLINDGLDGDCRNNGLPEWTYNQGVILGGLVELNKATGDPWLLEKAERIALAAVRRKSDGDGVIHEHCEPSCGKDGSQFKGVLLRNLRYLLEARPNAEIRDAVIKNADVIWANNRDERDRMGIDWQGPPVAVNGPTHSSALDALVAAITAARQQ